MRNATLVGSIFALVMVLGISIPVYAAESVKITGELIDTYCYFMLRRLHEPGFEATMKAGAASIP